MGRASLQSACRTAVGVALVALVMHTWLLLGLVVPVTVAGSSMAPTFHGPHREYRCDLCRAELSLDVDDWRTDAVTVCPHCRKYSARAISRDRPGDKLIIDRTAYLLRPPRRWEVVVFRSPIDGSLCIKRVVGLPGETIALTDRGLLVDGRPLAVPGGRHYELRYGDDVSLRRGCHLRPDEFFVLGDNAEISDDSRSWPTGPALDAKLLVGKPLGAR